ncbi:MAG: NADH-quinone oxidoreductase subunit NuoG [Actinobacteria bacterium]|nr:NADH-quinone oxidoreductase subunit NuoG [Actinomycetota bacterium]
MSTTEDTGAEPDEAIIEPDPDAVAITINGRSVTARRGDLVIAAAERAGDYIPRFCYHPRMSSVGMCRQCLVEIDTGRGPMLQPSCMVTVSEGMVVDTESETSKRAQEGILELLLANHPLDCPVCDKGGECPLQDQAFSHGPGESRYVEEKRHYEKPIPISDLVFLDRERCILCDRCTRFADEVAGDALIHFIDRGNATQVNTFPDEPFSSYFSGNTVQICPVGALTAKPYRFKARPWDLEQVESTCTSCSVGCRISVHSSRDRILRFQGVDDEAVNWGWLCDRGRFNFESVHSDRRLADPLIRTAEGLATTDWSSALSLTSDLVRSALAAGGADSIAILGGARGTNEDALAWSALADALGIDRRDARLGDGVGLDLLDLPRATIADAAAASTIVLIAPDLKEELPVLHLRLRDAALRSGAKIIEFTQTGSGLTRHAWRSIRHLPGAGAQIVSEALAEDAVAAQLASGPVVVVAGRANLAESAAAVSARVAAVLSAAPDARVLPVMRRGNTAGALAAGLSGSAGAAQILRDAAEGRIELLILLGADPLADFPDSRLVRTALARVGRIVSLDGHLSASSEQADIVLPVAVMGEKSGTTTNLEGRVTPVAQKVTVHGTARPDWMIALDLAGRLGVELGASDLSDLTSMIELSADGLWERSFGAAAPTFDSVVGTNYDFRLVLSRRLYDAAVSTATSPSLESLPGGRGLSVHPSDLERIGVSSGDDVKVTGSRGSVVLPVCVDDRVNRGTVWAPFNQPTGERSEGDVRDVVDVDAPVTDVRIERLS